MPFFRTIIAFVYSGLFSIYSILWGIVFRDRSAWETLRKSWASTCLRIVGIRLEIEGQQNLESPAVFVMNHQSILDLMTSALLARRKQNTLLQELLRVPLVGRAVRQSGGCIFIDRAVPKGYWKHQSDFARFRPGLFSYGLSRGTRSQQDFPKSFKRAFLLRSSLGFPSCLSGKLALLI